MDPDTAASKAYYSAFYAVSALFLVEGRSFTRHAAVEAAVHRDLVNTGVWSKELGKQYSRLFESRLVGDYGGALHVDHKHAVAAINDAREVLRAISMMKPDVFPWQEGLFP
jgi:uncharacterized protein (UPF0332 family)